MPSSSAPGSTASLRPANQRRVIELLRARPTDDLTQAEIARTTGLAGATVSNIVRELAAAGLVDTEPGSGRRGTVVRLARAAGLVAGIDFGHTHVAVAVADLSGRILGEARAPSSPDHAYADGLAQASVLLEQASAAASAVPGEIRAIGLGLPAPVSEDIVRSSAILPGWVGVNARRVASEHFGLPVLIENDANLGVLAEHRAGAARGHHSAFYVKVSSGVGGGVIINDQLFRGADGTAGEIGHLTLDEQGPLCRCGSRGCLEAYASTGSALALVATQLPGADMAAVIAAAEAGNVSTRRLFEDAGLHLGWGMAAIVNLLNPSIVIVGGDMALAGELLLAPTRIGLRRHALADVADTPVVAAALGDRASLIGAVMLASDEVDILPD
jgi:predicted NBD/HSP70 family sugar kinase